MTDEKKKEPVALFMCGPSRGPCKCNCPDGPCDHVWDGPEEMFGENCVSATCSKCGMLAVQHDLWVGP